MALADLAGSGCCVPAYTHVSVETQRVVCRKQGRLARTLV